MLMHTLKKADQLILYIKGRTLSGAAFYVDKEGGWSGYGCAKLFLGPPDANTASILLR